MSNFSCNPSERAVTRAYAIVKACRANETIVPYDTLITYMKRYATLVDDVGCIKHSPMFDAMRKLRCADSYKFSSIVSAVEFLAIQGAELADWYKAVSSVRYDSVNDSATWSRVLGWGDSVVYWCDKSYRHAPYTVDDIRFWADYNMPKCIEARCEAVVTLLGDTFDECAFDTTFVNAVYSVVKKDYNADIAYRLLRNHLHDLEYVSNKCVAFSARGNVFAEDMADMLTLD